MTNGNDAAFRTDGFVLNSGEFMNPAPGLTKREYFAAMAMQGLLTTQNGEYGYTDSTTATLDAEGKIQYDEDGDIIRHVTKSAAAKYAEEAVRCAGALIGVLNSSGRIAQCAACLAPMPFEYNFCGKCGNPKPEDK